MKHHPNPPDRLLVAALLLTASLLVVADSVAQTVFHPGNTYEDIGASGGAVGECQDNSTFGAPTCEGAFNTGSNRINARAFAAGVTASVPPEKHRGAIAVSIYKDFRISTDASGEEADLLNSYVSADIRWAALLIGTGFGTASYKIEFLVIDRSDPNNRAIGYAKLDDRTQSGTFKSISVKGVDIPVPAPDWDRIEHEDARTVIPVPLKRGRTYRVRLTLTVSATGGVESDGSADFHDGLPLVLPNPQLVWDNLTVTVGVDMLALIRSLEERVDSLKDENARLALRVDENTASLESHTMQIIANKNSIGLNYNRIDGHDRAINANEQAIKDNADKIAAVSGSAAFAARVDTLESQVDALQQQVGQGEIGASSPEMAELQRRVDANRAALDTLEQRVDGWSAAINANSDGIVENASRLAGNSDSTVILQQMVECHVHESGHADRTGWPLFETQCANEATPTSREDGPDVPVDYQLSANYPNPFNPSTTITFDLPRPVDVTLTIYDVQGRMVKELVSGSVPAGRHEVTWEADQAASGVYLYRIQAGAFVATRSMILIK